MLICTRTSPCNNIRICDYCCRRRQAKIADKASAIAAIHHQIYLSVITPLDPSPDAIKRARANIVRHHESRVGLWTVEKGEFFGQLHLNIMTTWPTGHTPPGCKIWEDTQPCHPRNTAAYISKRKGIPAIKQYPGNYYGHWNHVSQLNTADAQLPIIQAAAIEDIIARHHPGPAPPVEVKGGNFDREIARQHLRHIHSIIEQSNKRRENHEQQRIETEKLKQQRDIGTVLDADWPEAT